MKYVIRERLIICSLCRGKGKYEDETCPNCNGKRWTLIDESWWYPDDYYPEYSEQYRHLASHTHYQ